MPRGFKQLTKTEERDLRELTRKQKEDDYRELLALRSLLECRAGKLLKKGKRFIVVAVDEPYFLNAYKLIRETESAKGTWTAECEKDFQQAVHEWLITPCG